MGKFLFGGMLLGGLCHPAVNIWGQFSLPLLNKGLAEEGVGFHSTDR